MVLHLQSVVGEVIQKISPSNVFFVYVYIRV